jgi:hypothetical protein
MITKLVIAIVRCRKGLMLFGALSAPCHWIALKLSTDPVMTDLSKAMLTSALIVFALGTVLTLLNRQHFNTLS